MTQRRAVWILLGCTLCWAPRSPSTLIPFLALGSIASFGGQLVGQRLVRPTEAALIYALEPLVAAHTKRR